MLVINDSISCDCCTESQRALLWCKGGKLTYPGFFNASTNSGSFIRLNSLSTLLSPDSYKALSSASGVLVKLFKGRFLPDFLFRVSLTRRSRYFQPSCSSSDSQGYQTQSAGYQSPQYIHGTVPAWGVVHNPDEPEM